MSYTLKDLMQLIEEENGEAIHLHGGEAPVLEIGQELHRVEGPALGKNDTINLLATIVPSNIEIRELTRYGFASFRHQHSTMSSFQIMAFREEGQVRLELRRIVQVDTR